MTHDAPSGSPLDSTQACTIVLRGASSHLLDEAERSLHDALCVLSQVRPDAGLNARTVRRSSAIQKLTPTRRAPVRPPLQTVKDSRVVYGGGHMEITMAKVR